MRVFSILIALLFAGLPLVQAHAQNGQDVAGETPSEDTQEAEIDSAEAGEPTTDSDEAGGPTAEAHEAGEPAADSDEAGGAAAEADESAPESDLATNPATPDDSAASEPGESDETASDLALGDASRRIGVVVVSTDAATESNADVLSEIIIATVAGNGIALLGKEEIQAQLEYNEAELLRCISTAPCLGRLGSQLGIQELLSGTLSPAQDGERRLNLDRIDVRSGEVIRRAFRQSPDNVDALIAATQSSAEELFAPEAEAPASLQIRADHEGALVFLNGDLLGIEDGSGLRSEVSPGTYTLRVEAPGYEPFERELVLVEGAELQVQASLAPIPSEATPISPPPEPSGPSPLLYVAGGLAVAGAAMTIGFGLSARRTPEEGGTRAQAIEFAEARQRDANLANVGIGVMALGGALAITGLFLSELSGSEENEASVRLTPSGIQGTF